MTHFGAALLGALILVAAPGCAVAGWQGASAAGPSASATPRPADTATPRPAQPTVPASATQALAPIVVTAPSDGDTVRSPVRIAGNASVFEAAVSARVKDATGRIIGEGFGTASEGAPGRGAYSFSVTFTPPSTPGPGTVEVFSTSARDGSVQFLVSRRITLSR